MNDDEVIASQARQLETLRGKVEDYEARLSRIRLEMVGIGGPLNDNKLGYSNAQLMPFSRILDVVKYGCPPSGGAEP